MHSTDHHNHTIHQKNAWKQYYPCVCLSTIFSHRQSLIFSYINVQMYRNSPGSPADQSDSQRLVWSAISVSELRLSSAMWYRAGSACGESCDWLVWAILSRECTMAWRRQVIHCCLLNESLACRQYGWSLERPLALTRKQFLTVRRKEKEGKEGVSFTSTNELELHDSLSVWACTMYSNSFIPHVTTNMEGEA